jgi:CheY-like chemotaxis protein
MTTQTLQRILYVEDEPDIQAVARIALEAVGGFQLLVCSSGQEALAAASAFAPNLILLDVMMPDMDGPSTLVALRALPDFKTTPIVFMTAKVQSSEVARYRQIGALDVIAKPFDPMTLSDTVRDIWSKHHGIPS